MSKLVLIDGNAILHRAYHAMPPMRTPIGEPIAALYGFVSMTLGIIEKLVPTHLVVCFDRAEKTFRREKMESYQSHRPAVDTDLSSQFQKTYELLKAMKIAQYSKAGYEADDMIGTIATEAIRGQVLEDSDTKLQQLTSSEPNEVVIVTGDRDILQLVNDWVKVYMPIKGMSEGKLYGEQDVLERMDVLPKNIVDYKALVGDASDNYPGVPGVGPKTAVHLIHTYGTFDEIYKHIDELPKNTAAKLEKGKESGILSYELATIVKDCDIDFDLEEAGKWDIDSPAALKIFEEYGFKTLPERVKKLGKKLDESRQGTLW